MVTLDIVGCDAKCRTSIDALPLKTAGYKKGSVAALEAAARNADEANSIDMIDVIVRQMKGKISGCGAGCNDDRCCELFVGEEDGGKV